MAMNQWKLTDAQRDAVEGLKQLGKVRVENVGFAYGKQTGSELKTEKSFIEFDFSDLEPTELFGMLMTRAFVVQYRAKYWLPITKQWTETGEACFDELPDVVGMDELCTAGKRGGGSSKLKAQVVEATAKVMMMQGLLFQALYSMNNDPDKDPETIFKQTNPDISYTMMLKYLSETNHPELRRFYNMVINWEPTGDQDETEQ
jgi:hypothetical protein